MELPLVVGVDGSESSLQAVDWAVDEAARHGLPLRLVYASLWERYEGGRPAVDTDHPAHGAVVQDIAASCAERARVRAPTVNVSSEMLRNDAEFALLDAGRTSFALVTGSRGRGGVAGTLLGSVSLAVAGRAVCPVVVVRGEERNREGSFGRVLIGVGDATAGSAATRFAFREAEVRGGALSAVRAWRNPAQTYESTEAPDGHARIHEERASAFLADALRGAVRDHPEVDVLRRTVEGPAHRVLLEETAEADLIVVGALRRHGRFGLQLGRVAHALLHHSACPVAIVPQRD